MGTNGSLRNRGFSYRTEVASTQAVGYVSTCFLIIPLLNNSANYDEPFQYIVTHKFKLGLNWSR